MSKLEVAPVSGQPFKRLWPILAMARETRSRLELSVRTRQTR